MSETLLKDSSKIAADLLIIGATEVVTCVPSADDLVGRRDAAWIAIAGDRIAAIGPPAEIAEQVDTSTADVVDASGQVVAPGYVDCHTHLVFGGSRVQEYAARMTLAPEEVAKLDIPVGISATVEMTRAASTDELTTLGLRRLGDMLRHATTTVESKTGYGLSAHQERKLLEVNQRLQLAGPIDVVSTFLGAHDFPPDMPRDRYVDLVVEEMIPDVAQHNLATFCDVYCDDGYYTVEESRRILQAGREAGLQLKIHTDAYSDIGGAAMAAELGVVSADHLNYAPRGAVRKLAQAGVTGVVMPALDFAVRHPRPFDARVMFDEGMTVALATDFCPACWVQSMQLVMALACRLYQFSPAEALYAATVGGARALGLAGDRGSLEVGKLADLQIWDVPTLEDVVYRISHNPVTTVIKRGAVRFQSAT